LLSKVSRRTLFPPPMAASDVRGPSKLEGTVHVNVQFIRKFMKNYFFNPVDDDPAAPDFSLADDSFLFNQGPTKGLGKIQFHDYKPVFEANKALPNVATFVKQIGLCFVFECCGQIDRKGCS